MIIFDLDGTLADCEHRKHFIEKPWDVCNKCYALIKAGYEYPSPCDCGRNPFTWEMNWKAFYESCDQDKPTMVGELLSLLKNHDFEIWSGRCESVRNKTLDWLKQYFYFVASRDIFDKRLKMRPIGDNTPDDQLKERWLDEAIAEGKTIDFVFDDRPKVVRMWRRRDIFVFNCYQHDEEF